MIDVRARGPAGIGADAGNAEFGEELQVFG
jgi:hypothetical protein